MTFTLLYLIDVFKYQKYYDTPDRVVEELGHKGWCLVCFAYTMLFSLKVYLSSQWRFNEGSFESVSSD